MTRTDRDAVEVAGGDPVEELPHDPEPPQRPLPAASALLAGDGNKGINLRWLSGDGDLYFCNLCYLLLWTDGARFCFCALFVLCIISDRKTQHLAYRR